MQKNYGIEREFNMLAGITGVGKSTFTANYCKRYAENVLVYKNLSNINDKAFAFLPEKSMTNWRQGAKPDQPVKCKFAGGDKKAYKAFLDWILAGNYTNGLLVIDDATIYERDRLTEQMNQLVTMRRHLGIDIWLNYHGLTLLPIEQFVFVDYLIVFMTTDNIQYKASKLPNMERLIAGINQAKANFNSGKVPLKYTPVIVKMRL
jgi:hypothetical protein